MPENLTLISHCLLSLYRRVHDICHIADCYCIESCQFGRVSLCTPLV